MKDLENIDLTVEDEKGVGYLISIAYGSDYYIQDAIHIEKDDELNLFETDAEACLKAESDGIKFIYGMKGVPDRTYIDTPENRATIKSMLKKYPEYKRAKQMEGLDYADYVLGRI